MSKDWSSMTASSVMMSSTIMRVWMYQSRINNSSNNHNSSQHSRIIIRGTKAKVSSLKMQAYKATFNQQSQSILSKSSMGIPQLHKLVNINSHLLLVMYKPRSLRSKWIHQRTQILWLMVAMIESLLKMEARTLWILMTPQAQRTSMISKG